MMSTRTCIFLIVGFGFAVATTGAAAEPERETRIEGQYLDPRGLPIPNARILVLCEDYDTRSVTPLAQGRTNREGYFSLGRIRALTAEDEGKRTHIVLVPAGGGGPAWKRIRTAEPEMSLLRLMAYEPEDVFGSIRTEDSEPVVGARVWVRRVIPPEATDKPVTRGNDFSAVAPVPGWSTRTGADGSFRIEDLPKGATVEVVVAHRDWAKTMVQVKPGVEAGIDLEPAATITGRVLHGKTGKPAANVRVQAQATARMPVPLGPTGPMFAPPGGAPRGRGAPTSPVPGGRTRTSTRSATRVPGQTITVSSSPTQRFSQFEETVTDEQGRYRLESLHGNTYNVWALAEGLTVVALDSFDVKQGQTREAPDLLLVEGGFIWGRVVDEASGEPVKPGAGSNVAISGPSRPESGAAVTSSPVGDDGSFRIRVAPGHNRIQLRPRGQWGRRTATFSPRNHRVEVGDGQTVEVVFTIRKLTEEELERGAATRARNTTVMPIPKTVGPRPARPRN